jgi:tripartite-type tricarboxylate transporter receptor subunit TctC
MMSRFLKTTFVPIALAMLPTAAAGQAYPTKPIKMVVPFAAGAISDGVARFVADRAGKALGTTFVIENKAGANGSLGARDVARAAPDGYTIIVSSNSAHAANLYLYKELNYDPVNDFVPVTGLTKNPHLVVVRSGLPVKDMKEFVTYAKENDGKLSWGTGNSGSLVNASLLMSKTGVKAVKASYRSQPQAVVDLLAGRIDFMTVDYFNVSEHMAAGTVRALGVTSNARLQALPDVPPVADTIPNYEVIGWIAVFAPAKTPAAIVDKLNKTFVDVLNSKEVVDYMQGLGMLPFPTTPAELGAFQKQQIQQWTEMLQLAGVERE